MSNTAFGSIRLAGIRFPGKGCCVSGFLISRPPEKSPVIWASVGTVDVRVPVFC